MNAEELLPIVQALAAHRAEMEASLKRLMVVLRATPRGEEFLRRLFAEAHLAPETVERVLRGEMSREDAAALIGLKLKLS